MRILFITRKYPPSIGGMETFSVNLVQALGQQCTVLALGKTQLHLVWWLSYALIRGWWLARQVDCIHLGDGVLAGLGVVLQKLTHKPVSITLHGLDVTYQGFVYQRYIWSCLHRLSACVCVSQATAQIVQQHGIPEQRMVIITHGITLPILERQTPHPDQIIFLTVGRLVKRKGVAWFIAEVLPHLPPNVQYWITSTGPEVHSIRQVIAKQQLNDRVTLLGVVDARELARLYQIADVFIMPNISQKNDMEGFGIVAIEAAAYGLPIAAANLEGMRSAVIDGATGFLLESGNAAAWRSALERFLQQPFLARSQVRQAVAEHFSVAAMARQYQQLFNRLVSSHGPNHSI